MEIVGLSCILFGIALIMGYPDKQISQRKSSYYIPFAQSLYYKLSKKCLHQK